MQFINHRREEKRRENDQKEADRLQGAQLRRIREAETFFSEHPHLLPGADADDESTHIVGDGDGDAPPRTPRNRPVLSADDLLNAHATAATKLRENEQKATLRSKFNGLKAQLVRNGVVIAEEPPEGRLLIIHEGSLVLISDEDEFSLLSCGAAIL